MIKYVGTTPRMSKATIHNGTVYLCGQVGAGDDITAQTKDCLARIDDALTEAGSSKDYILQAIIWLADIADFEAMNAIWDEWVPAGNAPARATCAVDLAKTTHRIEIVITAAVS